MTTPEITPDITPDIFSDVPLIDSDDIYFFEQDGERQLFIKKGDYCCRLFKSTEMELNFTINRIMGRFTQLWCGTEQFVFSQEMNDSKTSLDGRCIYLENGARDKVSAGILNWENVSKHHELSAHCMHYCIVGDYDFTNKKEFALFDMVTSDEYQPKNFEDKSISSFDLFCGIGGMGLGLKNAGIHKRFALDMCMYCTRVYENANPDTTVVHWEANEFLNAVKQYFQQHPNEDFCQVKQITEHLPGESEEEFIGDGHLNFGPSCVDLLHCSPP